MCDRGHTITHLHILRFYSQVWFNTNNQMIKQPKDVWHHYILHFPVLLLWYVRHPPAYTIWAKPEVTRLEETHCLTNRFRCLFLHLHLDDRQMCRCHNPHGYQSNPTLRGQLKNWYNEIYLIQCLLFHHLIRLHFRSSSFSSFFFIPGIHFEGQSYSYDPRLIVSK